MANRQDVEGYSLKDLLALEGQRITNDMVRGKPFYDTGRTASMPAEHLDALFGAPARVGIAEMQGGEFGPGMLRKVWQQIGRDPQTAPTGEDIVANTGMDPGYLRKALGFGVDVAADLGGVAGLLRRGAVPLAGTVDDASKKAMKELDDIINKYREPKATKEADDFAEFFENLPQRRIDDIDSWYPREREAFRRVMDHRGEGYLWHRLDANNSSDLFWALEKMPSEDLYRLADEVEAYGRPVEEIKNSLRYGGQKNVPNKKDLPIDFDDEGLLRVSNVDSDVINNVDNDMNWLSFEETRRLADELNLTKSPEEARQVYQTFFNKKGADEETSQAVDYMLNPTPPPAGKTFKEIGEEMPNDTRISGPPDLDEIFERNSQAEFARELEVPPSPAKKSLSMGEQDLMELYKKAVDMGPEEAAKLAETLTDEQAKMLYEALEKDPVLKDKLVKPLWFDYKKQKFRW
jgi:hypothetical protein